MIKKEVLEYSLETIINRYDSHKNVLNSLIEKKQDDIKMIKVEIDDLTFAIAEKENLCVAIINAKKNIRDDKRIHKTGYKAGAIFLLIASATLHYLFDNNVESMFLHTGIIEAALPIVCGLSYLKSTFHNRKLLKKHNLDEESSQIETLKKQRNAKELELSDFLDKKEELEEKRESASINLDLFKRTLKDLIVDSTELLKQPEEYSKKYESVMSLIRTKTEDLNKNV